MLSKVKDLVYDISDVLMAFLIVAVAAIVISVSIGNIVEYPSIMAEAAQKGNDNFGLAVPVGNGLSDTTDSAINKQEGTKEELCAVYINPGESTRSIAAKFVSVGYFESVDQFIEILESMNAASKIKTGNFIIPTNATKEEVITKITTTTGQ